MSSKPSENRDRNPAQHWLSLSDEKHALVYLVCAGALTLWVATLFFSQLRLQLFLSDAALAGPSGVVNSVPLLRTWSAPLDDVFIHFDFARSAARGFPGQWSEGNGYSSGGTSLLYPWVLALGYALGFERTDLMLWAGVVACLSVLYTLNKAYRLFIESELPRHAAFVTPILFLGIGALSWSLFSGMEVAFFMAVWAFCLGQWLQALADSDKRPSPARAGALGLACAALVATRPESVCLVAVFGATYLWSKRRARLRWLTLPTLLAGVPALLVLLAQGAMNRYFTGEWSAAGALVKLEANHPYLTRQEVFDAWWFHIGYQIMRITEYHLAAPVVLAGIPLKHTGWFLWLLAAAPLFHKHARRQALLLWLSALSWVLMVALNGQVRWQNERYSMPALALLLVAAALGVGVLLQTLSNSRWLTRWLGGAALAVCGLAFAAGQLPRFREQLWFFGRASRNIHDQHMSAAKLLEARTPKVKRVLLGDAGAIPFISDLPALDLVGLGGYHDFPFARASRLGVGAAIELIERIPTSARPDVMAVYPSWWGDLTAWFGQREAAVPVRGNVICGGAAKVIYRANWQPLSHSSLPFSGDIGANLEEIDIADLLSERAHHVRILGAPGYVQMKMLPNPKRPREDLWDAGRLLPPGAQLKLSVRQKAAGATQVLLLRFAPTEVSELRVSANGTKLGVLSLLPKDGWEERSIAFPSQPETPLPPARELTLEAVGGSIVLFHAWVVELN